MSSKRLYELARDMGLQSAELVSRIEELGLNFKVSKHTDMLSERQVEELQARMAAQSAPREETRTVRSGVIRRRVRVGAEEPAAEAVAPAEAPPAPAAEPAPTPVASPSVEPAVEAAPEAPKARFAVRRTRAVEAPAPENEAPTPVEAPPPAPEPEAESAAEPSGVTRRRFATVRTRDEEPATEIVDAPAPSEPQQPTAQIVEATQGDYRVTLQGEPQRSRFATVVTTTGAEPAVGAPSPVQLAAIARREVDARAGGPRAGAARVVGTIQRDVLSGRLEPQHRDAGPRPAGAPAGPDRGAARDANKKGAKRVVQSRDLYDKSAGARGRGAPVGRGKGGRGAPMATTPPPRVLAAEHKRVVRMEEAITVSELAQQMSIKGGEIAMKLMFELGMKGVNINTTVDFETATLIAELYGFKVEQVGFDINKYLPQFEEDDSALQLRPAVVTVMGHVDHGKTSLLDAIRKTAVASGEAGGITQHIGAYLVDGGSGPICFLDTPGHEAFTALRARGAKATDLVVLVVAADDGVMPQTVEAISHAKAAGVPILVAVNKIDKPGADASRVKQALTEYELVPEDWGGSTIFCHTSAVTGEGIDALLEMINLQAEVLELRANPDRTAEGLVLESRLDVGRGPVASVLVQQGTLTPGEIVVIGQHYGRVRTMIDERGRRLQTAGPSTPVELTGLSGVPTSGERFYVVRDERDAKVIAEHVAKQAKASELAQSVAATGGLEGIQQFIREGKVKELKVIIKGDVQGSVEALSQSLVKLSTADVRVRIVHQAVGGITENDVNLASASREDAAVVIIGFNVRPDPRAQALADSTGVVVFTHNIIYDIIDQVRKLMAGLLEPVFVEEPLGRAEVRATFNIPRVGTIAGCMVLDGTIERNARCRVVRDSVVVYESTIGSLRHFEKDVKEVKSGFECGLGVDRFNDVKSGDIIEVYRLKEVAATL
jgi:translation initiation factor IF-2